MAACEAAKEILWLRQFLSDVGELIIKEKCVSPFVDSQSAIKLIRNPVDHKRTKHIDVKYNIIRKKVQRGLIKIMYVELNDQMADILTKLLPTQKFDYLKNKILRLNC